MSEHQTLLIIDKLEGRVAEITRRYKSITIENERLQKHIEQLEAKIAQQDAQMQQDATMINTLSAKQIAAYNNEAKDALKTYLDQVIELIDANINLLK